MEPIEHGGALEAAMARFPDAPRPWIDLSTGINPHPYPFTPPPPEAWCRLPEAGAVARLEAAAARAYGVRDPAMVVAAPGTQALIQLLPRLLPQRAVTVVGPTYAEHAAAWRAAGAVVTDALEPSGRAAVLCNPNNPDGRRHDPAALARRAAATDLLVVDEAFADFEPGCSAAGLLPCPGLVILRSFGKAYGLAGLRLGFLLADPAVAARVRAALGPWAVSGPAVAIGTQALGDTVWREAAERRAQLAVGAMRSSLDGAGLKLLGGTVLFQLVRAVDAELLTNQLACGGILVRRFPDRPGLLRFGTPADDAALVRLSKVLRECNN